MGEGCKSGEDLEQYETIHHQNLSVTNQDTTRNYFEGKISVHCDHVYLTTK